MIKQPNQLWRVFFRRKVEKQVGKIPRGEQALFANTEWPNFSKLARREYHCHLSYSWVVCWRVEPETMEIEVYYAGSPENAPY